METGSTVGVQMHWEPHYLNYPVQAACWLMVGGLYEIEHTPTGTFHFQINADGSIAECYRSLRKQYILVHFELISHILLIWLTTFTDKVL